MFKISMPGKGALLVAALLMGQAQAQTCGVTWTPRPSGQTVGLHDIAIGASRFVAVGDAGTILSSGNMLTWTKRNSGVKTATLTGVVWAGTQFVAVGSDSLTGASVVLTSPDGLTWTRKTLLGGNAFYELTDVAWSGVTKNRVVTVGNAYTILGNGSVTLSSIDTVTWQLWAPATPRPYFYDVIFGNNRYVAVGNNGAIQSSLDSFSWTARASGVTVPLNGVQAIPVNQYVAVGDAGTILTSADVKTWVRQKSNTTARLNGVFWAKYNAVALGDNGTVLTSPDGVTWSTQTSGVIYPLESLVYGKKALVAVGGGGTILTSPCI